MNNRAILATSIALIAPLSGEALAKAKPQPQNVLFILVDDLGWNDLGCMGSEYYETPNIDSFAQTGVLFTDAYASCSFSSPSRASILSGLYTANHGITKWISGTGGPAWRLHDQHIRPVQLVDYSRFLDPDFTLMPELLRDNGYTTFIAGKWHVGEEQEAHKPLSRGFDIYKERPHSGYFSPENGYNLSMRYADDTVAFIEEHKNSGTDKPFFAYLSFNAVHSSIQSTEEYWRYFRDKAIEMGVDEVGYDMEGEMPNRLYQDNPVYAGLVKLMDDAVGHVLDALSEMGLDDNTLIIFTSDNGGTVTGDAFATSLRPLRAGKGHLYEGGIRVPLIIRDPRSSKYNGRDNATPVSGVDFYPTIMSYAGIDIPSDVKLDGADISSILTGQPIAERPIFWHIPHYSNLGGAPGSAVRHGDWKLIYWHGDRSCELYNLKYDISESMMLNAQNPEKVEELRAELMAWLDETNAKMPEVDPLYDSAKAAQYVIDNKTKYLHERENERMLMLDSNYKPNDTWWASQVVPED